MEGTLSKDASDSSCRQPSGGSSVTGRVQKKKGLSRHYPNKAQSFDCIAGLFLAASTTPKSSLLLSKSLSSRSTSLRHMCNSQSTPSLEHLEGTSLQLHAAASSTTTIHECPHEESWSTMEHNLCNALQELATLDTASSAVACRDDRLVVRDVSRLDVGCVARQ